MSQHQQVDVSRDHFVVSYTVKEVNVAGGEEVRGHTAVNGSCGGNAGPTASPLTSRPDILAAKPKSSAERAKRPEVLFRKSEDAVFPSSEADASAARARGPKESTTNHHQRTLNLTTAVAPKAQVVVGDGRSNNRRIRAKAWEGDKGCHANYELNGNLIKEQLMSTTHIPESCV
ncbi:uncharacterized protein LOC124168375 [Ischnura elegans]|uniref:uncharacterized protein LOC124168375 n=1 Tax=Ischnura elegans TaxID=197161 RepID=UPI001ED8BD66|nr:uncharacterized protein LOC124168375 [Ischnura elegans]